MENREETRWGVELRAKVDVWIEWLCALLNFDENTEHLSCNPESGGKDCPVQFSHNNFAVRKAGGCGFFFIVTGSSGSSLWLTQASHKYVFYEDDTKRKMVDMLKLEEVQIPPHSVFVGNGYLQLK